MKETNLILKHKLDQVKKCIPLAELHTDNDSMQLSQSRKMLTIWQHKSRMKKTRVILKHKLDQVEKHILFAELHIDNDSMQLSQPKKNTDHTAS